MRLDNEADLRNLLFVSKNGQTALQMLKKNPIPLKQSNYKLFPNIETHVLFSRLESYDIKDIKNTNAINENIKNEFFEKIDAKKNAGVITSKEANILKEEVEQFIENIKAHVYGHQINYNFYLDHNLTKHNVASGIIFTQKDRIACSNEFQQPIPNTRFFKYNVPPVTHLDNHCFENCYTLQNITIPNSVTSLGDLCFENCSALQNINIPNSVTSLGGYCFKSCRALQNITIPNSITSLGDLCFENCDKLQSITIIDTDKGDTDATRNMLIESLTNSGLNPDAILIEIR